MSKNNQHNLISHLEVLRSTLIKCFWALAIGLIPMFAAAPYAIESLIKIMMSGHQISLNYFSPMEVFILQVKTAVVLDLLVCFPYIAKQIWKFVLPALYDNERKFIQSIVLSSSFLFISGVLFSLFLILPLMINFGLRFATADIQPLFGISNIISMALWLSVVFGLMFQFPLITYALISSNIASYESVKNKRPYIIVIILIVSALITPPDVLSQLMLAIPTSLLFEAGLYFAKKHVNKHD